MKLLINEDVPEIHQQIKKTNHSEKSQYNNFSITGIRAPSTPYTLRKQKKFLTVLIKMTSITVL